MKYMFNSLGLNVFFEMKYETSPALIIAKEDQQTTLFIKRSRCIGEGRLKHARGRSGGSMRKK
jgi:hypothetical protein